MAGVQATDASGEVDVAIAVDIFQNRAFGLRDVNRGGMRKRPWNGAGAALAESALDLGPGNRCFQLNRRHLSTIQLAASFKLMCTCLVSRYSSMPHGPSSRPKPDCL